jgi:hypothetical protein
VREAAAAVRETLRSIVPDDARPPNTAELKNLVDRGGLHFEAKLARIVEGGAEPAPARVAPERGEAAARQPERGLVGPDLKGDLLRLLHTARELGGLANAPAVAATLDGIENLQAANVLAQDEGSPYFLQVPFPDGDKWQTLHLGIESEQARGDRPDPGDAQGFRMLMHIPLTDLGETWVDAALSGDRFRAVLYLDQTGTRDRVRAELPGLRDELLGEGFGEVLLDVRSTADLPAKQRRQGAAMRSARPESVSVLDVKV